MEGQSCFRYFLNRHTQFFRCCNCGNHIAKYGGVMQLASPPGTINLDNEYICRDNLRIVSPARYSIISGRTFVDLNCSMCKMFMGRKIVHSLSPADDFEQEGRCLFYLCNLQFWDGDGFSWAPQAMGNRVSYDNFAIFLPISSKM